MVVDQLPALLKDRRSGRSEYAVISAVSLVLEGHQGWREARSSTAELLLRSLGHRTRRCAPGRPICLPCRWIERRGSGRGRAATRLTIHLPKYISSHTAVGLEYSWARLPQRKTRTVASPVKRW